jgi:hypothetical protein
MRRQIARDGWWNWNASLIAMCIVLDETAACTLTASGA